MAIITHPSKKPVLTLLQGCQPERYIHDTQSKPKDKRIPSIAQPHCQTDVMQRTRVGEGTGIAYRCPLSGEIDS